MERNITLDYFKLFLCFLVILAHLQPLTGVWNSWGSYFISNGYARITVPCFFIINGYYLYPKASNFPQILRYVKKIFIIYIVWSLIYLGLTPDKPSNFFDYLFFFFVGIGNLWYVAALLIAVFLYYLTVKTCKKDSFLLIIAFVLFYTGYTIQYFLKIMLVKEFDNFDSNTLILCRNFLFLGLPFIILGGIIKSKYPVLKKIPSIIIIIIIIVSIIILTVEIYYSYSTLYASDFYAVIFVLSPSIFLLVLQKSKYTQTSDYIGHLSQAVYFVHPIAIYIVFSLFSLSAFGSSKLLYIPIIVFFCLILSTGIIRLNREMKIFL